MRSSYTFLDQRFWHLRRVFCFRLADFSSGLGIAEQLLLGRLLPLGFDEVPNIPRVSINFVHAALPRLLYTSTRCVWIPRKCLSHCRTWLGKFQVASGRMRYTYGFELQSGRVFSCSSSGWNLGALNLQGECQNPNPALTS